MTAKQVELFAAKIASDSTFYVEARVGSANYRNRGEDAPCRAVWRDGSNNMAADVLIREMAIYIQNRLPAEQPRSEGGGS